MREDQIESIKNLIRIETERYALELGLCLEPVQLICDSILSGLTENVLLHGAPYCPCKVNVQDNLNPENICPCSDFKQNEICHCGLFLKPNEAEEHLKSWS